jgi:pimeloyl-ACP methyl ester carboxylesterase
MSTHSTSPVEKTLVRDGCAIHYWVAGARDAPLVVFTHGAGIDHREWEAAGAEVARNFATVSWDVRAHGASRPNTKPFTMRR